MALTIDRARTALLPLDLQHDNITATPGIKEKRVLEHTARLLEAARRRQLRIIPRDGRITERAVTSTEDFMIKIGAIKARIPYDKLVTHDFLPK